MGATVETTAKMESRKVMQFMADELRLQSKTKNEKVRPVPWALAQAGLQISRVDLECEQTKTKKPAHTGDKDKNGNNDGKKKLRRAWCS